MSDVCKSCGAVIIWITDQKGTRLPVNKKRVRAYVDHPNGKWRYLEARKQKNYDTVEIYPDPVYISHFVTCPNATKHSKRNVD